MRSRRGAGSYLLVWMAGAAVGAVAALWVTEAMPKMMARMMREMMAGMDSDMCRQMLASMAGERADASTTSARRIRGNPQVTSSQGTARAVMEPSVTRGSIGAGRSGMAD